MIQSQVKLGWWIAVVVLILDQASKFAILATFETYERLNLLPVFDLVLVFNTGAAFSFLAEFGGAQRWIFLAIALLAVFMIHRWLKAARPFVAISLGLILGGALGNGIDRAWQGAVTDFLLVYYQGWYFPAFNLADCAITLGAVGMIIDAFQEFRRERTPT